MRLPIDTSATKIADAGPSEPFLDFATKAQRTDENGMAIFQASVFAAGSGVKDSITIKVAGEVKGLSEFTQAKLAGPVAQTWEVGHDHGVRLRAERIENLTSAA